MYQLCFLLILLKKLKYYAYPHSTYSKTSYTFNCVTPTNLGIQNV
ncbi:hypothetical protein CCP3SC1AL1_50009 [Gammaproteobacteria bacterium]